MERVRIAILDGYDNILAFMDNGAPKAMHYYNDELHEYLKGTANTFTFTSSAKHEDSEYLIEGNKIAFVYRDKDYYLNIMTVRRDELEVEVTAFSLSFELLNEEKEEYAASEAMTFEEYLDVFDYEKVLTLGNNEVSDKSLTLEWTGTNTLLARIFSLATAFSAEAEFVVELNSSYSLERIVLNIYKEHSDTVQGIGTRRTDVILRYGKNVTGITKTSDITGLYTAIRPIGRDGLTVASLDKSEYDADGNLEYSSPEGNRNILAVQARDRFPSNLMSDENDRYIAKIWKYDTNNVNVLYGQALAELKKNCVPQVEYEIEGYFDTNIGDTVMIDDDEYTPELYLEARVTEQVRSFTDQSRNKTTFDNYREIESQTDRDLETQMNMIINSMPDIKCGSKVLTASSAHNSLQIFTISELNELFGVSDCSEKNTYCQFSNGDGDAQSVHLEGATYLPSKNAWYAVFDGAPASGNIRINYIAVYYGEETRTVTGLPNGDEVSY